MKLHLLSGWSLIIKWVALVAEFAPHVEPHFLQIRRIKKVAQRKHVSRGGGATLLFLPLSFYLWPATDLLTSARPENGRKTRQASTIINLSEATRQQRVLGWSYLDFSFPPWSRFESLKTIQKGLFAKTKNYPTRGGLLSLVCFDMVRPSLLWLIGKVQILGTNIGGTPINPPNHWHLHNSDRSAAQGSKKVFFLFFSWY